MGYHKIQQRRDDLKTKQQVKLVFRDTAAELNRDLEELHKAQQYFFEAKKALLKKINALNTADINEFAVHKKSLLAVAEGSSYQPLPLANLEKVVDRVGKEVEDLVSAYEDKLTAPIPKDVTLGMTFKDPASKKVYEIKSGPEHGKNPNLKGDDLVFFVAKSWIGEAAGTETKLSLADLKKMKYIDTM